MGDEVTISSVVRTIKCSGADCFCEGFGRHCKVDPGKCQVRGVGWRWDVREVLFFASNVFFFTQVMGR